MKQIKVHGIVAKLAFIGVTFCILLIALVCIRGQLSGRQANSNNARHEIWNSAGERFCIDGPYVAIPVVHTTYSEYTLDGKLNRTKTQTTRYQVFKMDDVAVDADIWSEMRTIGIYSSPVFTGNAHITAAVAIDVIDDEQDEYLLDKAKIFIDAKKKNLTSHPVFVINGTEHVADVISVDDAEYIGVDCALARGTTTFGTTVGFRGARQFSLVPSAKQTALTVECDWPSPGFTGFDYLPDTRDIRDDGFTARWSVPFAGDSSSIGFTYVQPVDVYKQLSRALTYGFLFIIVPFIVMFLFELFAKVSLHPVHYLLCGAASVIFFLLLLALSEHIPFVAAYLAGSVAAGLLVSLYLASVTHNARVGTGMAVTFALLYAYLYFSLKSEDYAFVIGAVFAFVVLAAVMFCTRNVDWAAFGHRKTSAEPARSPSDSARQTVATPATQKDSAYDDDPWGVTT